MGKNKSKLISGLVLVLMSGGVYASDITCQDENVVVQLTERAIKVRGKPAVAFSYQLIELNPSDTGNPRVPVLQGVASVQTFPWGLIVKHGEFEIKIPYAKSSAVEKPVSQLTYVDGREWRFAHLDCGSADGREDGFNLVHLPDLR